MGNPKPSVANLPAAGASGRPRLVAFDLDGTLTQHKSPMSPEIRAALDSLRAWGYSLLMAGAGSCELIARQMENYPIDSLGNYGLQ